MRLYLASQLHRVDIKCLKELGCKYVLFNFYDLQKVDDDRLKKALTSCPYVMIDSGAFHLQHDPKQIDYEEYINNYIAFIIKWKEYITEYVELDVDNKVSLRRIDGWTKRMSEEIGKDPIVVWHPSRGYRRWEKDCEKYGYIGFSGAIEQGARQDMNPEKDLMPWFIDKAEKYKTKVHGFAFTKPTFLERGMFYSVDSATWTVTRRYGQFPVFEGGNVRFRTMKTKTTTGQGVSYETQTKIGMLPFVQFQGFAERYL